MDGWMALWAFPAAAVAQANPRPSSTCDLNGTIALRNAGGDRVQGLPLGGALPEYLPE
jgi:hypothetical protein